VALIDSLGSDVTSRFSLVIKFVYVFVCIYTDICACVGAYIIIYHAYVWHTQTHIHLHMQTCMFKYVCV
jgi:hypothetical protein